MPQDLLSPDEFGQMLDDPEFVKLPIDTRKSYVEKGIGEASRFIAERGGGWTPEKWQQFGNAAQQARQFVNDSETLTETGLRYAGVAGQAIKDLPAIVGAGVVGLSPVLPDGKPGMGVTGQVPLETLGPALGRNVVALGASAAAMMSNAEKPLVQKLDALKQQIDAGDFLTHKDGFAGWIDQQHQAVKDEQAKFYGDTNWAEQNSLLGSAENAQLMQNYLATRSPEAWQALQSNVLRSPLMAKLQADKTALETQTKLGRALTPEAQPLISEAADPAEVVPGLLAAKKGMEAVARGASRLGRAKDAAKGLAGEMLGEQVSATIDNPYLTAEQRLQVAKDSMAGALGLMGAGAGVQAVVNRFTSSPNDNLSPNQTAPATPTPAAAGAPAQVGASAPQAVSTLSRIAQESLVADLPEDTGALTAEDVQDLEGSAATPGRSEPEAGRSARAPLIPQGVGQPMSDPNTLQAAGAASPMPGASRVAGEGSIPSAASSSTASVTKDSGATADQTAQNTPGAGLSPATGSPLTPERTPEQIAESAAAEEARRSQIAQLQGRMNQIGRGPVIPDSPLGGYDILDFVNENKIRVPRADSAERKAGEYDWTETYSVPQYYRKFLGSSDRGGSIDQVAQAAFEGGFIREPTADALMGAIQQTIDTRQQYRVQFAQRAKEHKQVEKQVLDFEKTQQTLRRKDKDQVRFEDIAPGDEMTIDGEQAVVKNIEYTEDGYLTNVVIEDGKRFGLMQFDPQTRQGIFVDEYTPKQREQPGTAEEPLFSRAAPNFTGGLTANLQAAASQNQRLPQRGRGAEGQGTPPTSALGERWWAATNRQDARAILEPASLEELKAIATRMDENANQTKAKLIDRLVQLTGVYADSVSIRGLDIPRGPMPDYTGESAAAQQRLREQKAARALEPKERGVPKAKPRTAEEFARDMAAIMTTPGRPTVGTVQDQPNLASAYTAAARGSSTQMLPIRAVYEQAKAQNPALTPAQFMAEVQAGDRAGTVLLEPFDTPQGLKDAGEFVARNASGVPSTRMMVQSPSLPVSESPSLPSPATLAANQKANEAILRNLGLPTAKGTRVWGAAKVKAALAKLATDGRYPATTRRMALELSNLSLDNLLLKIEADARLNWAGLYQPFTDGRGELSLNTRVLGSGATDIGISLVHEALHHATYRALRNPKTARQKQAKADLEALFSRARAALAANEQFSKFDYELSNLDEFITGLWTRADFQTALAGIPADQAPTLGQRVRSMLDEIFRVLAELVTGKQVQTGSVLDASFAATLRLMGEGQGNAAQDMPALLNPAEDPQMRENRSRMALSEEEQRMYEVQGNDIMLAEAEQWLAGVDNETAVRQIESGLPPAGLRTDHLPALTERTLQRLVQATTGANEIERLKAEALLDRASTAHQDIINRERGRGLQQVGAANDRLAAIMPIMGAKKVLIDRADAVVKQRFNGGAQGVKAKIEKILAEADLDISERVERILATVMQSALKPITSLKDAVAALMPGKSQREQMIEDVAQALMVKARGNVVTPERKTALAALAASLKQTLGASVQGDAKKAATSPLGEVLARAFVDQVSEGPLFTEAWQAGRQSVFDMFYDMELDKAFHPARMRAEQAASRLKQLEAGSTEQQAASATERAELKTTLAELKAEMQTAKAKADGMTDTFWQQVGKLMPATPTMAYAPGMSKEAIKRGFEMAGYTAEVKTGMKQDGTRTLNVQDALRDPKRAMQAVLNVWDAEAQAAGIDPAAWQEGRKLAWQALNETLNEWQTKANERAAKLAQAQKDSLMAKDSPALVKLLKLLAGKIAPGMDWTEIFTDLQGTQKARQLAIYERLMKDERLQGLTQDERIALTNELDKAWMRERRTVFNRELQKAGILGEKKASDRLKVKNAMPKLLRLINLGMFNSEMFREVIAPEYKLRVIDAKTAATLRGLAEAAYAQPEGVLRNRKLGALLTAMQSATGSTLAELVNNYWTAAVLSGTRTQFDTWLAGTNGMGTNLIQAAGLLVRGRGKDAVAAHAAWWRGLIDGTRESLQILAKGDYSMLKRFGADLNKAMQGESGFRPLPLGESLWKNGTTFQKYAMAPVMIWTGRLMAAADHINNTATTAGAMSVARALHPEYYGRTTFSEIDQANARAQALREVTGGSEPTTAADKATVSVRVRELLYGSMRGPERLEANEIGDMAAFQNDPTGIFGTVYAAMKAGLGTVQRAMDEKSQDVAANAATRAMAGLLAGSLHGLTGTRFMRFGFNFGAELTRYVPGTSLMDRYTGRALYGKDTGPMQRELTLGKNVVGLMLGSTLAALFLSSDDEDEGWQIEGDWSLLTPQQVKERMSAGLERLTMWKRDGDKIRRVSYKQWPTMGLFAVVGGMLDEKRHKPDKWAQHDKAGHLLRGMGTGMLQIKNVSAVRNLVEIFGGTRLGGDPSTGIIDDVLKVGTNFAGGFVPTAIKDAEVWNDPRNFKPEGWAEELQRSMPIARRFVNDGRPQLNLLGEEVKLQRSPWSRAYTSVQSAEAHRVLGALLARGLSLPMPSDQVHVFKNGVKVPLDTLGRAAVWKYEKAVGTGYKEWLSLEGSDLLKMTVEDASNTIKRRAESIKTRAKAAVTQ